MEILEIVDRVATMREKIYGLKSSIAYYKDAGHPKQISRYRDELAKRQADLDSFLIMDAELHEDE